MQILKASASEPSLHEAEPGTVTVENLASAFADLDLDAAKVGHLINMPNRTILRMLSGNAVRRKSVDELVNALFAVGFDIDPEQKLTIKRSLEPKPERQAEVVGIRGQKVTLPPEQTIFDLSERTEFLSDEFRNAARRFRKSPEGLAGLDMFALRMAKKELDDFYHQIESSFKIHNTNKDQ